MSKERTFSRGLNHERLRFLLEDSLSGEKSIYLDVLRLFCEETGKVLETIEKAWDSGDREIVIHMAHRLRSNALNVGAEHFAFLCAQIEEEGRAGRWSSHAQWISELKSESRIVVDQVEAEIEEVRRHSEAA